MNADSEAVLAANALFYAAFDDGNLAAMEAAWAEDADLACVHPGWPPIRGRTAVMQSWAAIFANSEGGAPTCEDPTAHVHGDTAYVVCRERLGGSILVATNVFTKTNGIWVLLHHHSSALARVPPTPDLDPELLPN